MNYNFNSQFLYSAWTSGNPFMPNAYAAANNTGTLQPSPPPHPAIPSAPTGFCSSIIPGILFSAGIFPYGMNGSFPSTFPNNWSFNYNNDVSHFNQVPPHSDAQNHQQLIPAAATAAVINQVQNDAQVQNIGAQNAVGHNSGMVLKGQSANLKAEAGKSTDVSSGEISDELAAKVTNLLSNPNIFKSALALSQLKSTKSVSSLHPDEDESQHSTAHLSSNGSTIPDSIIGVQSENDTSLNLESNFTFSDSILDENEITKSLNPQDRTEIAR